MWTVLYLALDQHTKIDSLNNVAGPEHLPSVKTLDISPSEGIFLLTALSNMAVARNSDKEKQFIDSIAILIIEVCYHHFLKLLSFVIISEVPSK